jgi:hypothetical protein
MYRSCGCIITVEEIGGDVLVDVISADSPVKIFAEQLDKQVIVTCDVVCTEDVYEQFIAADGEFILLDGSILEVRI